MSRSLKDIAEFVHGDENVSRVKEDLTRFIMYQGRIRDVIAKTIETEFKQPETIKELKGRIVAINIIQKIINKLAAVYQQAPNRSPLDKDPGDQELIDLYEKPLKVNQIMKFANRYFKLHKHVALEFYLDHKGVPRLRALPSQTYTPFGDDPVEPHRVTTFVKHVHVDATNKEQTRLQVWTDEEFVIINGKGEVMFDEMLQLNNPEGVNPFGVIPFTYLAETDDGSLIPIPDDDLVSNAITIPLLLTDLAFASKYQLWSVLASIGADSENMSFNPNSIISLPAGADLKVIKPEVDIDQGLRQVESLISMLLTSKNLTVGDVTAQATVTNVASGAAKMLDRAETTEDRKDQEEFFRNGEREAWEKFAHNIMPVWVESGNVDAEYVGAFSPEFELAIRFADPKPFVGDKDRVELEITKIDNALTTQEMALQVIHPDMDQEQIDQLKALIEKEKQEKVQAMQETFAASSDPSALSQQMNEEEEEQDEEES